MLCYDIDDATLRLILEMQMEDLADIKRRSKGKHREDEHPDSEVAIAMYMSEIENRARFASDRTMCMSMAQANHRDGHIVSAIVEQEEQAVRDRELAVFLSQRSQNNQSKDEDHDEDENVTLSQPFCYPSDGGVQQPATSASDEFLRKLHIMYMDANAGDDDDTISSQPESSSWGSSRLRPMSDTAGSGRRDVRRCTSCLNEHPFTSVARCPCGHEYCTDCLRTLFEMSIIDESLFPPRCCRTPIPVDENRIFLTAELVGRFRAREVEFSTANKTYCHGPRCSQFIPEAFIKNDVAVCQRCRKRTCTMCKEAEHKGEDCPQDIGTQAVLRMAELNQWQRCTTCSRVVELDHGCNHMTCRCGAQFCYICGAKWKTCGCDQWAEERLISRAETIVGRHAPALNPEHHARRVERAARQLAAHHQCEHPTWRTRKGPNRCEECHESKPHFIYECARCRIHACRDCRYNRF
ncbi:E3 ubiquitin-protein ligase [Colletotrichum spinosum]|uniref:RBR-type E3 ubiquitin transferase n=2 Tax=Colletotrichum orbiculare species complex TaxID=2707354 RepID=A0A4R8QJS4_9PEZI|nr:E3 ubiquitin-protein ligase [Colletotrichum spinosum]